MIGKQRHGPTGNIKVEFESMFTKFRGYSKLTKLKYIYFDLENVPQKFIKIL